jgi:hypothetical protein
MTKKAPTNFTLSLAFFMGNTFLLWIPSSKSSLSLAHGLTYFFVRPNLASRFFLSCIAFFVGKFWEGHISCQKPTIVSIYLIHYRSYDSF